MTPRLALLSLVLLATTLALLPQPATAERAAPLPNLQGEAALAHLRREGLDGSLAKALTEANPTFMQQAYIRAANPRLHDEFGRSVAISGDTLLIGRFYDDSNGTGGSVCVFERSAGVWSQQTFLKASNTHENDWFGWSVAISGDTLVVGANGEAYVFVRNGGIWSQEAYLEASNTGAGDTFGWSVAISGDTLVVGAPWEDSDATGVDGDQSNDLARDSGAAYVFVRNGGIWSQEAYLKASNTQEYDWFGWSVAVSGDTLVAGTPYEDSNATGVDGDQSNNSASQAGAAYVFVRSAGAWSQQAYLKASNTGESDFFGRSVAISGDILMVGAPLEDSNAIGINGDPSNDLARDSGAAYLFMRSAGTWSQQAYLKGSNTDAYSFGESIAISGDTFVVGAFGTAYIFRRGAVWRQQTYLEARSGSIVAISGNTVVVGAPGEPGMTMGEGAVYVFVPVPGANLAMVKVSDVPYLLPGEPVVFTLTATNQGDSAATGVTVTDTLPDGLTYGGNDCGATFASPTLTWTIESLANLASATCHLTVTVDADVPDTLVNSATVTGNETDPDLGDNEASATLTAPVDLEIVKTVDDATPALGGTVVFTLTVTSQGPGGATGVIVTDTLPAGLTYGSNDCGAAFAGSKLTWTIGALANLASVTCHLTVTVDAGASQTIVNTATVDGNEFDLQVGDNADDATLTIIAADLQIQKTADDSVPTPGGTVTFTLTATNQGFSAATGTTVTDTLPAGLTYGSNDCGATFASPTLTWTIGVLANLASATCHLTVTVDTNASGTIVNSATVTANETDPDLADNVASATLTVPVDLKIIKTADNATPAPGGTVGFTLTAINQGPTGATGVVVTDTLPTSLIYGNNDCGAAFAGSTLTWTIGALANLASATCHLTVTVDAGAWETIVNTAAVDGNEFDPQTGDNAAGAILSFPMDYYTLTPCRLVDTRLADGPLGGPALAVNVARDFVLAGACGVPADAAAVVLNVTAVEPTAAGSVQIYRTGSMPLAGDGAVYYRRGRTRAGNRIVTLGAGGTITALAKQPGGTVHLILDVAGYFF
jgi:uncharacterized repeat protein (TIGR01451 family)